MCACVHVCVCACVCEYMWFVCMCMCTCVCPCMHWCVCMYVFPFLLACVPVADPGKGAQGACPPYFVNASIFKKEQLTIFIVKSERFGNERFKQKTKMSE